MEIKIGTKQMLWILYILSWIIFVGVCIDAGGFLSNTFYTMVLNPVGAKHFWQRMDLSALFNYDRGHFLVIAFFMCVVAVMKAWMFYLIIMLLHDKKLNMGQPFSKEVGRFMFNISYLALLIGLFSWRGVKYTGWLADKGITMPGIEGMGFGGADVWLFMSVVLFVVAHIFKRGIQIQKENELTI
ncbi:DUF2975 domain-containing protein [Chitinophaga alhagiae]|uniref:DUF2975 domain-containing protein n=1 Tax=Chitinophaga alhagiae TaxID=2203219 RepID=UPI000E5B30B8|nr:DUF2975 domain-containing protein [Chitinophaga alhagiae]